MLDTIKRQSKVIDIINEYTPGVRSLTGLTLSAIADWVKRNVDIGVSDIQGELEEISRQIGCLHDKSNPPREQGWDNDVDIKIQNLREILDRMPNL